MSASTPARARASAPTPAPQTQLASFLSRFPPEIIALAKRCLPKLRRAVPCTHELVYDYPNVANSLVVTLGMSERGYEGIVSLAIKPDAVRLYFSNDLPDPKGILEGKGGKVRSVIINAATDLDHADIQALFKAATKHAGVSRTRTGSTTMIIKSATPSKKKASKKKSSK